MDKKVHNFEFLIRAALIRTLSKPTVFSFSPA